MNKSVKYILYDNKISIFVNSMSTWGGVYLVSNKILDDFLYNKINLKSILNRSNKNYEF